MTATSAAAPVRALRAVAAQPADEIPPGLLDPPAAAARSALLEATGLTERELLNWLYQLGDEIAAHIDGGGTALLTDADGTSRPLTAPTP